MEFFGNTLQGDVFGVMGEDMVFDFQGQGIDLQSVDVITDVEEESAEEVGYFFHIVGRIGVELIASGEQEIYFGVEGVGRDGRDRLEVDIGGEVEADVVRGLGGFEALTEFAGAEQNETALFESEGVVVADVVKNAPSDDCEIVVSEDVFVDIIGLCVGRMIVVKEFDLMHKITLC